MKSTPQRRQKKTLSAEGLIGRLRSCFKNVSAPRVSLNETRGKKREIPLAECLMSGVALFKLKWPSLLVFDQYRNRPEIKHNLKTLFGIERAPSDTYMREQLDNIDPAQVRKCFLSIFEEARRGKLLERYRFMDDYLILVDGTEVFNSENVHCKNCCQKNHKDGRVTYHHQVLGAVIAHPNHKQVIPLCPEPIIKQDGKKKNDCERNAMSRFLGDLKKEHPKLKGTIVSDALSANTPQINEIKAYGYNFIVNVKPGGNSSLFEWLDGLKLNKLTMREGDNEYVFSYVNGIPLNQNSNSPEVNFLKCESIELKGKKRIQKTFTWVTSHEITQKNIYTLMRGARARWKIENETFNTLKNQEYRFEHNFGHGNKNLHVIFTFLMMLAFLVDQVEEAACGLFEAALKHLISRRNFWSRLRALFELYFVDSWEQMLRAMGPGFTGSRLGFDTS